MGKTLFSQIIDREIESTIIAENEHVIVIEDIQPKAPIHYLIIPKKEIENVTTLEDDDFQYVDYMFRMAQHISQTVEGAEGFKVLINNGKKAGQEIPHLHMHFLAGYDMKAHESNQEQRDEASSGEK